MRITFLIGNGFDLSVGLASRYSDYFPVYEKEVKEKDKLFQHFSDEINSNIRDWSDFELELGKYTKHFDADADSYGKLIAQIDDFLNGFIIYLKRESEKLTFENKETIATAIRKSLLTFYSKDFLQDKSADKLKKVFFEHSSYQNVYDFINFNYTEIFDKCINLMGSVIGQHAYKSDRPSKDLCGQIVHVHGTLENYPLVGVNDKSQIVNTDLANDDNFTKLVIKPSSNTALKLNRESEAISMIKSSTVICTYGMSLGQTDKKWWALILEQLSKNLICQLVLFIYDDGFSSTSSTKRIQKEAKVYDRLQSFIADNSEIDFESVKERIYITFKTNLFDLKLKRTDTDSMIDSSEPNIITV